MSCFDLAAFFSTLGFLPREIKKSRDVILVEGLHTLYPRQLLEELDVSFFIDLGEVAFAN